MTLKIVGVVYDDKLATPGTPEYNKVRVELEVGVSYDEKVYRIRYKLKCQVVLPFTRDRKNPDSSGTRTHFT